MGCFCKFIFVLYLQACWNVDGSKIYVGRRNCTFDEFDIADSSMMRSIKLPNGSGAVYNILVMPNNSTVLCASFDNIRLYDLKSGEYSLNSTGHTPIRSNSLLKPEQSISVTRKRTLSNLDLDPSGPPLVPFTIVPGHHGGVISGMTLDPTGRFLVSCAGNRGWEGGSNNNVFMYFCEDRD